MINNPTYVCAINNPYREAKYNPLMMLNLPLQKLDQTVSQGVRRAYGRPQVFDLVAEIQQCLPYLNGQRGH